MTGAGGALATHLSTGCPARGLKMYRNLDVKYGTNKQEIGR